MFCIDKEKSYTSLHYIVQEKSGYQQVKKGPNWLKNFWKLSLSNVSLLGLCRCWSQENAWSKLLQAWCSWNLPHTEAPRLVFEGFKRDIQIFLLPPVSGFFFIPQKNSCDCNVFCTWCLDNGSCSWTSNTWYFLPSPFYMKSKTNCTYLCLIVFWHLSIVCSAFLKKV